VKIVRRMIFVKIAERAGILRSNKGGTGAFAQYRLPVDAAVRVSARTGTDTSADESPRIPRKPRRSEGRRRGRTPALRNRIEKDVAFSAEPPVPGLAAWSGRLPRRQTVADCATFDEFATGIAGAQAGACLLGRPSSVFGPVEALAFSRLALI
jgi:hypothetical protein